MDWGNQASFTGPGGALRQKMRTQAFVFSLPLPVSFKAFRKTAEKRQPACLGYSFHFHVSSLCLCGSLSVNPLLLLFLLDFTICFKFIFSFMALALAKAKLNNMHLFIRAFL